MMQRRRKKTEREENLIGFFKNKLSITSVKKSGLT